MKPVMCRTKNDCVRACVASILEMETEALPHWFEQPEIGQFEMQRWLAERGMIAACIALPGEWSLSVMQEHMRTHYRDVYYMLWCDSGGDHAVVGRNDEIVWNPAWYRSGIDGPHSAGCWIVWVIARI